MLRAVLTDVHANLEAFEACLEHAARRGAQAYALLGDFVGYGADPGPVVDIVMSLAGQGAVVVGGNHDEAAVVDAGSSMNDDAQEAIAWTRSQLSPQQRQFLQSLPKTVEAGEVLYVHANAWAPAGWEYISGQAEALRSLMSSRQRLQFCGHVHDPAIYHLSDVAKVGRFAPVSGVAMPLLPRRRWLLIPGSVGQPRDGVPAAAYALYDDSHATVTCFRVPYDNQTAAAKVRAAGLPAALADRLITGA